MVFAIIAIYRVGTYIIFLGGHTPVSEFVKYVHEPFNVDYPNKDFEYKFKIWFAYMPNQANEQEVSIAFTKIIRSIHNPFYWSLNKYLNESNIFKKPLIFLKHFIDSSLNKRRILIKDPIALLSAEWLYEKFNFKVICMIRHPLSFVGSLKKWKWSFDFNNLLKQKSLISEKLSLFKSDIKLFCKKKYNIIEQASLLWNILNFVILDYKNKYSDWLFFRYEDLVMNPYDNFKKIYTYLGLDYSNKISKKVDYFISSSNKAEADTPHFQPRNAIASLNTWKKRLTKFEIDKIINRTKDITKYFYTNDFIF